MLSSLPVSREPPNEPFGRPSVQPEDLALARPSRRHQVSRSDHGRRLLVLYLTDTDHEMRHVPRDEPVRSERAFVPDRTGPASDPDVSRPRLIRDASFLETDQREIDPAKLKMRDP